MLSASRKRHLFRALFVASLPVTAGFLLYSCSPAGSGGRHDPFARLREAWDAANDPGLMLGEPKPMRELLSRKFLQGESSAPWSDSYWPLQSAGVADRWIDTEAFPPFEIAGDPEDDNREAYDQESGRAIDAAIIAARQLAAGGWLKSWGVSPAEKYDIASGNSDFALTRSELEGYAGNRWTYEKDEIPWGWMGHCHGWAQASIALPAPRHSVLAKNRRTGQSVLMTEGDVRALLTKIASDNGTVEQNRFAGTRCEDRDSDIPRDRNQRIVDAALGVWDDEAHALVREKRASFRAIFHSRFDGGNQGAAPWAVLQRISPAADQPVNPAAADLIWVQGIDWIDWQRQVVSPVVYSVRAASNNSGDNQGTVRPDLVLWAADRKLVGRVLGDDGEWVRGSNGRILVRQEEADAAWRAVMGESIARASNANRDTFAFKSYKECRDINPATFHTTLVNWLGGRRSRTGSAIPARGFVIDLTRTEQVWNQGLWRYESKAGEPTPLEIRQEDGAIRDPFAPARARGTAQIVDFVTRVDFGVENGPFINYSPDDEISRHEVFRYTLEFDADGKLLGGEWHGLASDEAKPLSGTALLKDLNDQASGDGYRWQQAPDFIWGVAAASGNSLRFRDSSVLRASVVEAIHRCSLNAGNDDLMETSLPISGADPVKVKYVPCEIE
ncbi:MAG: hypothetical protein RIQ81_424 [Pseudomonadota bacterium]